MAENEEELGGLTCKNDTCQPKNKKQKTDDLINKPIDINHIKAESGNLELQKIEKENHNRKMRLVDYDIDDSNQEEDTVKCDEERNIKIDTENEYEIQTDRKSKNLDDVQDREMSLEEGEIRSEGENKNVDDFRITDKSENSTRTQDARKSNIYERLPEDFENKCEKDQSKDDSPKRSRKRKWSSPDKKSARSADKFSSEEESGYSRKKKSVQPEISNYFNNRHEEKKHSKDKRNLSKDKSDVDVSNDQTSNDYSTGSSPEKSKTPTKSSNRAKYREEERPGSSNIITDYETAKKNFEFFFGMKSPFSQFHPAKFVVDGITFSCAEQYMMYQKAVLFKDKEIGKQILQETKPLKMKRLGRKVRNFDPHHWGKTCEDIVKKGNIEKFSQNPDLEKELIDSYPKILAESSPRDCLWGIGLGAQSERAWNVNTWRGKNLLGNVLMNVRKHLMKIKGLKI